MIIVCPSCKKNFKVDANLIPDKGRLLKCGACGETWFFNKSVNNNDEFLDLIPENNEFIDDNEVKTPNIISEKIKSDVDKPPKKKGTELVRYKPKSTFTFGKFLSYLIVFIITFIAAIIVLDTFKSPLSLIFPNLELVLYNLFETLKDLILFTKDLK